MTSEFSDVYMLPMWDYSSIDSWALGDNNFSHKK